MAEQNRARVSGLGQLFIMAYDHLGSLVLLNIAWVMLSLPWFIVAGVGTQLSVVLGAQLQAPAAGAIGLAAGITFCVYSPPSFMLLVATGQWLRGEDTPDRARLWEAVRNRFWPVQIFGLLLSLVVVLLLVNALFYHSWGGWSGAGLSGFMLWLLLGLIVISLYWLPLLALAPTLAWRQVLRQSLFLAFSHPLMSILLLLTLLALAAAGLASGIGWCCGVWAMGALQLNLGTARLRQYYGGDGVLPTTYSWRNLLRPWE